MEAAIRHEGQEKGIKISTGAPDIAALSTMEPLIGMEGFTVYYYDLPKNKINDWLVAEHKKRFNGDVPDLFTPGGMSAAISIVEALKKTNGNTDTDKLISTMEGMSFETPKGKMTYRKEDHQALQTLYAIKLEKRMGFHTQYQSSLENFLLKKQHHQFGISNSVKKRVGLTM